MERRDPERREGEYGGQHQGYRKGYRQHGHREERRREGDEEGHRTQGAGREDFVQREEDESNWGTKRHLGGPQEEEDIGRVSGRRGYQGFGFRSGQEEPFRGGRGRSSQEFGEEQGDFGQESRPEKQPKGKFRFKDQEEEEI